MASKETVGTDIWEFQREMMGRLLSINALNFSTGISWLNGNKFWRGMGTQAAAWSVINMGIALFARMQINRKLDTLDAPLSESVQREQTRNIRRILAINAPLNLIYIASGFGLMRHDRKNPYMQGNGWGIVLQGLMLLWFDTFHLNRVNALLGEKESR